MTSFTSILTKRSLRDYHDVVRVAGAISKSACPVEFTFQFYTEDKRGGVAVGAKIVEASVVVPFVGETTRVVPLPTDLVNTAAFNGYPRASLRCALSVKLHNVTDANKYQFDSGPLIASTVTDDPRHEMRFIDTTPHSPEFSNKPFVILVRFSPAGSMTIESFRFTFTPDDHNDLVQLLADEARETRIDLATTLVTKARKIGGGIEPDFDNM